MKKVLCFMMSILMVLSIAGCKGNKAASNDGSVTLKWLYAGETGQEDTQKVWDYYNQRLAEYLPNTTVNFEVVAFADFAEKWKLKSASREVIDIAWTGYTNTYIDEISNGSFMELNELLDQYGQDVYNELPEWVWEKATLDGKIYSVPNYQMMNVSRAGLGVELPLKEKYLSEELEKKIIETNCSHKTVQKEDFEAIEEFLSVLKENDALQDGVSPVTFSNLGYLKGYEQVISQNLPFGYLKDDPEMKIVNFFEQDSMKNCFAAMRDWYEKGYIRKDIASAPSSSLNFIGGISSYNDFTRITKSPSTGEDMYWLALDDHYYISSSQANTATVIPVVAKHPERAMQLINLMNIPKGAELLNIISYGIENEHYTKVSDNIIDTSLAFDGNKYKYRSNCWVFGNIFNAYESNANPEGYNDYVKREMNENAVVSSCMGFKANLDSISTEISQVLAVKTEFETSLKQGILSNWEEKLDEMIQKMKVAGSDVIIAEIQRQLDEWRTTNNK